MVFRLYIGLCPNIPKIPIIQNAMEAIQMMSSIKRNMF